tara:strand:- start:864 stop:2714 length:1851 start_codon:yes stop_codon:yes gene_type:complete
MEGSDSQENKNITEVTTFPVPFALKEIQGNITITTNSPYKPSKEKIINHAIQCHQTGEISEAIKHYQYCLKQGFMDPRVLCNYGSILKDLGKLKEAEKVQRKAIEINSDFAECHYNLGNTLKDLGKLKEAKLSILKAIELKPDLAEAHSNLGNILRDLGNLKEAKLSTLKAIELKPNLAEAHSNLGNIFLDLGKVKEAELCQRKAIEIKPNFANAHSSLGSILKDIGNLKEAELCQRKAIKIKPNFANAHSNLGEILRDLGKLKEAELTLKKAIELDSNLACAYFSISRLKYSNNNIKWKNQLFSKDILKNKLIKDQIDLYFARSNILHNEKQYKESSKYLQLAHKLKLEINSSKPDKLIEKSQVLLVESKKKEINEKEYFQSPESIFIVGMFRSGTTLSESILSINLSVDDLGECNILEQSFLESIKIDQSLTLAELYWKKARQYTNELKITTNKWIYNYQYAGIIASRIPNSKIIHCYRHPLDNILSIYRTHFTKGSEYFSSLVDCARVYLNQEEIMTEYKKKFRSKIYDLNYDSLVSNPNKEIKSLISWLGWEWDNSYLSPHLNPRSVKTASSVQVRSPINSKSIGGWKNYKDMLKPAIEILSQTDKYQDIIS